MEDEVNASVEAVVSARQRAQAGLENRLGSLLDLRLKGFLEDDEYVTEKTKLKRELAAMELAEREPEQKTPLAVAKEVFDFAANARVKFMTGDAKTRRKVLDGLAGLNCILKDRQLSIQAAEWFVPIQNDYPAIEAGYRLLEPELSLTYGTKNALEQFRPDVRGRRDLNSQPPA